MTTTTFQYVGGAAVATLTLLGAIYHDRAVFDERRKDIKTQPGWPLIGSLPFLIQYKHRIHDFLLEGFNQLDGLTM